MLRRFIIAGSSLAAGAATHSMLTAYASPCRKAVPFGRRWMASAQEMQLVDTLPNVDVIESSSGKVTHPFEYDLIVIGGGSGGLAAAKRAAENGAKVVVCDFVDPSPKGTSWGLGGTCVNVGCIPKKLMHQAALLGDELDSAKSFGWTSEARGVVNWTTLRDNVTDHIRGLNFGYKMALREKSVKYVNGFAVFDDSHTVVCTEKSGKQTKLTGRRILLATGGRPTPLDIPGGQHAITSDDLFRLDQDPGRTLVVGAGYIALECAGFLQKIGRSSTVLVRSKPLRTMDSDMGQRVAKYMTDKCGVKMHLGAQPKNIEKLSTGKYAVTFTVGSDTMTEEFDTVLAAVGRAPQLKKMNLGVKTAPSGKILVDQCDRTSLEHVYAIGDVVEGGLELTPVAIQAGRLLADRLYKGGKELIDYKDVPTTVFTPLEYAFVGLSEEVATDRFGGDLEVFHQEFTPLEWTVPQRPTDNCYMKLLVQKSTDKVIGFHLLSPNAGEIAQGVAVAMKANATKATFDATIGIHPTIAENVTTLSITKSSGASPSAGGC